MYMYLGNRLQSGF